MEIGCNDGRVRGKFPDGKQEGGRREEVEPAAFRFQLDVLVRHSPGRTDIGLDSLLRRGELSGRGVISADQ
jgi:hypothetical protein